MGAEKKDVLEVMSGRAIESLRETVLMGRVSARDNLWTFHVSADGVHANRIGAAYSALWENALILFEIIDELASEVREHREKPVEVEEVGGVKIYASARLARESKEAKETIHRQKIEIERLREELKKAEDDAAKWQHRAREYQLDANAHKANFNAELEGNKKLREKFGARDNETWGQWLERMASEAAEAQKLAAKWETEFKTWKGLAQSWKRECEAEREATARLSERLEAVKKAVE